MLASGCGEDDAAPAGKPASPKIAAFPAKVEHQFGTTTVPSKPRRIVVVGVTEQDTVLALGYKPIATTEWYGKHPYAVWPWAQDELGDAPEVSPSTRAPRRIARVDPGNGSNPFDVFSPG